jgi:hypothetical protein
MSKDEATISGYLYKRTRDGRWQKRWFETNGVYLTYYKSRKMEKLLAALILTQVGEIKIISVDQDPEHQEGLFSIELNARIYILRAKSSTEAAQWVAALHKLRECGMQASMVTQTPLSNTPSALSSSTSVENGQSKLSETRTEWIKGGSSCLGCC